MERSESIKEIAKAICLFQQKVGKIKKESKNPFFKSKYASLANILDVIQTPLSECGLSLMQMPTGENGLETILIHDSGEWMASTYTMKPAKNDPQGIGSCITYQRRYAIGAILNLNIDDDDDGNKASGIPSSQQTNKENVSNLDSRKVFSPEIIKNENSMKSLYAWIERQEAEAAQNQKTTGFSVARLIEKNYKIGSVELQTIIDMYLQYKKAKNGQ